MVILGFAGGKKIGKRLIDAGANLRCFLRVSSGIRLGLGGGLVTLALRWCLAVLKRTDTGLDMSSCSCFSR